MNIIGIKKACEDAQGTNYPNAFWILQTIHIQAMEVPPDDQGDGVLVGGIPRSMTLRFTAWRDQAAKSEGKPPLVSSRQIINITEVEQFPPIGGWTDLLNYAYTVTKYHPTQTYFNDGELVTE